MLFLNLPIESIDLISLKELRIMDYSPVIASEVLIGDSVLFGSVSYQCVGKDGSGDSIWMSFAISPDAARWAIRLPDKHRLNVLKKHRSGPDTADGEGMDTRE